MDTKKLIELCDDFFLGYWEQEYAGAQKTCVFCGTTMMENGKGAHHSASCPIVRYEEIKSASNNEFDLTTPCCCLRRGVDEDCPHYSLGNCEHADRRCKST